MGDSRWGYHFCSIANGTFTEKAWSGSGGGTSTFFAGARFPKSLPGLIQSSLNGQRGIPDIAADADPATAMVDYIGGQSTEVGGTSPSTPLMAAIIAIADQMAGHPLASSTLASIKLRLPEHSSNISVILSMAATPSIKEIFIVTGFTAQTGWDAVTGWGSPQANQFIPALIAALK